jgi:hypothetical protein
MGNVALARRGSVRHLGGLLLTILALVPCEARADDGDSDTHVGFTPDFFLHDWRLEPLVGVAIGLPALALAFPQNRHGGAPDNGHHSSQPSAATASDVTLVSSIGLSVAGAALAQAARDRAFHLEHLRASIVAGEAVLLAITATIVPQRAIGRCRPYNWDDATRSCDSSTAGNHAFTAMWSGHTSEASAGAGALACLAVRERAFGWTAVAAVATEAISATTGVLRVAAGAHSWSDVGVGFVAGNALGVVVCLVHPTTPRTSPAAVTAFPGGFAVTLPL